LDISNGGQNHLVVATVGRAHAATASGKRIARKDSREIGLESLIVSSGFGILQLETIAEVNKDMRDKLRMLGVPVNGPLYVYGDNLSVNTSMPSLPEKEVILHRIPSRTGFICYERNVNGRCQH
jgi:hypothetical protein